MRRCNLPFKSNQKIASAHIQCWWLCGRLRNSFAAPFLSRVNLHQSLLVEVRWGIFPFTLFIVPVSTFPSRQSFLPVYRTHVHTSNVHPICKFYLKNKASARLPLPR